MSNKIIIFILFFFIIISCKKDTSNVLISKSFSEEYHGNCIKNDCAQVTIDYIKIEGENDAVNKINFTVGGSIIYFLNSDLEKNIKATTIAEASNLFIKNYENDKKEFPDISPYFAEISVTTSYSSVNLLSIKTKYYNYKGGAHGYEAISFLNFNPTNGNLIPMSSLLKNKAEFTKFAEQLFRTENNIAPNDSINATGFWFKNDVFYLPETIGVSENNVLLIYNQYEIASYARGIVELLIPLEKARPFFTKL